MTQTAVPGHSLLSDDSVENKRHGCLRGQPEAAGASGDEDSGEWRPNKARPESHYHAHVQSSLFVNSHCWNIIPLTAIPTRPYPEPHHHHLPQCTVHLRVSGVHIKYKKLQTEKAWQAGRHILPSSLPPHLLLPPTHFPRQ